MKRLWALHGAHLTVLFLAVVGCFVVLMLVLWMDSVHAANASKLDSVAQAVVAAPPPRSGVAAPYSLPAMMPNAETTPPAPITCHVTITTSDYVIASQNIASSSNVGNLSKLGLVPNPALLADQTTIINYFQLTGAKIGTEYTLEAQPTNGTNYDLGIYVYYSPSLGTYIDVLTDTDPTAQAATATFVANQGGLYIFAVFQKSISCSGGTYYLLFSSTGPTATPTNTPSSTPTPSVTPTSTPGWTQPDAWEPNEDINHPAAPSSSSVTGLTLYNTTYANPSDDQDWFMIYASASYQYSVNAAPETGYYYPFLFMEVIGPDKTTLIGQVPSSNNATINWTASSSGSYYIHIKRAVGSPTNGTYKFSWTTNAPTITPSPTPATPGPTDTPVPGQDAFEPNYDFDHAAGIGLNVKYTSINFVPTLGGTEDNDFFKLRVKRGMLVTCETLDLSAGTDTNMILYDNDRQGLAGNDDVDTARGELRSRVTVSINYDGDLYVLVGQGYSVPAAQASQYNYSLQCTSGAPGLTPTPTPRTSTPLPPGVVPTSSPVPQAPPSLTPPPTQTPAITVRPLATLTPEGPAQQIVTADLRVSYDANGNGVADPGEGVVGLPIRVYDDTTGALLAQGFTDGTGHAVFNVPSVGPVRVVVPYLGFEQVVPPSGAAIPVLISPRGLPDQIP